MANLEFLLRDAVRFASSNLNRATLSLLSVVKWILAISTRLNASPGGRPAFLLNLIRR